MADPNSLGLVVVAIPREDDYVWKISSEKVPHMTLLYLGENQMKPEQLVHISEYIEHASSQIRRFMMNVDRRGKLGDQDADVLFFDKGFNNKLVEAFRSNLLKDRDIYEAYNSTTQYPEWIPHLTLGYPETPAKPDKRDFGIGWVEFDRIALWTGDSEGPTFQLKSHEYEEMEVAMSEVPSGTDLDKVLAHYGKKGMKWGVRKDNPELRVGRRQTEPHSEDASRVGTIKTRAKTQKTTKVLSNAELRDAIDRMRLEQDFSKLSKGIDKTKTQKTVSFVAKLLGDAGKQTVQQAATGEMKSRVDEQLRKARV